MRISIKNFKSIVNLSDYELKPLTLLAGINSSGKSSLIQSILLLKQSVESDTKKILKLDGPYLYANNLLDLIYQKKKSNNFNIALSFDNDDFDISNAFSFFRSKKQDDKLCSCIINLTFAANSVTHLKELNCQWQSKEGKTFNFNVKLKNVSSDTYDIGYTDSSMVSGIPDSQSTKKLTKCKLEFRDFIPVFATSSLNNDTIVLMLTVLSEFHEVLSKILKGFTYIGPLRVKPELAKSYNNTNFEDVGIDGDYTRFILNQKKDTAVAVYNDTLLNLCKSWICDKMGLAKDMDVTRDSDKLYRMFITNQEGIKVDLMHMGFGLSQILPVIVQGFLTPVGGTLVVEDPDVHMHPKVQAQIMDFLLNLTRHGRKVLVETHSDHMVTRLRRRISESLTDDVRERINLSFVRDEGNDSIYTPISISDSGSFNRDLPHFCCKINHISRV